MSTHLKEQLNICICAGSEKHLEAAIVRMKGEGWRESGHFLSDHEIAWHWMHMTKEPDSVLEEAREALKDAMHSLEQASIDTKNTPVSPFYVEKARKMREALALLGGGE